MKNTNKGFTLIELLVVIAIIGILSSIVLASLNTARNKGSDAAVKGNLTGIRPQAAIIYDNTGSYATLCSDTTVSAAINAAKSAAGIASATNVTLGTAGSAGTATCHANGSTGWAVEVPQKTSGFFCVNDAGLAASTSASTLGANETDCQ